MVKIADATFGGDSGKKYEFGAYTTDTETDLRHAHNPPCNDQ